MRGLTAEEAAYLADDRLLFDEEPTLQEMRACDRLLARGLVHEVWVSHPKYDDQEAMFYLPNDLGRLALQIHNALKASC